MSDVETDRQHILLHHLAENNPDMLKELVQNPSEVLQRYGFREDALKCPEEAHKAFERGEEVEKRVAALGNISLQEGLPKVAEIVNNVFGKDWSVKKIPFGVQFSEKIRTFTPETQITTATGTVE